MTNTFKILVVDDEPIVCQSCFKVLSKAGYLVETLQSSRVALERVKEEAFDLAIVDLRMPGIDGMEFLQLAKETRPELLVIMITGYSTIENAVDAMKIGASDYIPKPFTPGELVMRVEKLLEKRNLIQENRYLRQELQNRYKFKNIIGRSQKMQDVFRIVEKVAPTDSTVLILGESGTGKELIARAIHYNSLRRGREFIPVECTSLSETLLESELFGHIKGSFTGATMTKPGLFEVANGGTFFLDEIGNLPMGTQTKLLRVLQEREIKPVGGTTLIKVDIRLVAATNKDIETMVKENTFRDDLFYRINVVPIFLPPLRERKGDIPLLANFFLEKYNREREKNIRGFAGEVLNIFEEYDWPGNVREFENIVERMVVMADEDIIQAEHLPANMKKRKNVNEIPIPQNRVELKKIKKKAREDIVKEIDRAFVIQALKRNEWNITRAAKEIGMKRQNFQSLMKKCRINPKDYSDILHLLP